MSFIKRLLLPLISSAVLLFAFSAAPIVSDVAAARNPVKRAEKFNKQVVHLKLKPESGVNLEGDIFIGGPADQTAKLNGILAKARRIKAEKLLREEARGDLQAQLKQQLSGYYKVRFKNDVDMPTVISELQALGIVETAYAEPKPAPTPGSANYTGLQRYLKTAPDGVNASFAKDYPGGNGNGVKIFDIEYSWNSSHEDLGKARSALIANGTPVDPFNDTNHGTAVIGELIGDDNAYGITGVTPGANLKLVNVYNQERGYDLVTALFIAAYSSQPGDVILIEQQTWGPTPDEYDFVPVEWLPEIYDMIKAITNAQRIVVEAAGNGNQNLDDVAYYGSSFPQGKPSSGAIIVGAGNSCEGSSAPRSRWYGSNYGKRVNLQGPGDCVATSGYGDLDYGAGVNAYYTRYFSGTSSAAPVVAAAAASLSSAHKTLNNGAVLTPAEILYVLAVTGTPQTTGGDALSGKIGPYPNLAEALPITDKQAPSIPGNVWGFAYYKVVPVVLWEASKDNVRVAKYEVFRGGKLYSTVTDKYFVDGATTRGSTYSYKVRAVDTAGRKSAFSPTVSITVQ